MSHRTNIFGVDRLRFEHMLDQPLREHLLAFTDGRQDLAPPRRFIEFEEPSETQPSDLIVIEPGCKVRRSVGGRSTIMSRDQLSGMPELSVSTRDYILSASELAYRSLMELFADFAPYSFARTLTSRIKRWWIDDLLRAFANWYGPESDDTKAIHDLFKRFDRRYPTEESRAAVVSRGFPPIPRTNAGVIAIDGWTTDETRFALLNLRTLLEYGGEPPHRETQAAQIGHKRVMLWDELSEPTPEEHQQWDIIMQIINRFLSLHEYSEPAVVSFMDV